MAYHVYVARIPSRQVPPGYAPDLHRASIHPGLSRSSRKAPLNWTDASVLARGYLRLLLGFNRLKQHRLLHQIVEELRVPLRECASRALGKGARL